MIEKWSRLECCQVYQEYYVLLFFRLAEKIIEYFFNKQAFNS